MKQRKIPMRKCVASQKMFPKTNLIRIVRTPENEIVIDLTGKRAGRGAYLCTQFASVDIAQKKKILERALKVTVAPEIYQQLREYVKLVEHDE
jgi:uncharacterized protein